MITPQELVGAGLAVNFLGLVVAWLSLRRHQREIHVLVNSKLDAALARGFQLEDAMKSEGLDPPPQKTLIPPGFPPGPTPPSSS